MMRVPLGTRIVLACALAGCAQWDTGSVARRRAAELLECEAEHIELTQIGEYRYRGEGCGRNVELACSASALEPVCLASRELATAGGEEPERSADAGAPAGPGQDAIEAHVRAGLEARREDVLACVGQDRVAVRVAYAPDGAVDFSLQGAMHGTPEERCVQDAMDGVRVAASGIAGVVVHLVH